jgi:hypothetical protein
MHVAVAFNMMLAAPLLGLTERIDAAHFNCKPEGKDFL